jgi:hypothetical protein
MTLAERECNKTNEFGQCGGGTMRYVYLLIFLGRGHTILFQKKKRYK